MDLLTFCIGSREFQRATVEPSLDSAAHRNPLKGFLHFLSVIQRYRVSILPITWQPALGNIGYGASANIHQSMGSAELLFAFKRIKFRDTIKAYQALISEVVISSCVEDHPNTAKLEGFCWEVDQSCDFGEEHVKPALVYEKSAFGDPRNFLCSENGRELSLDERLSLIWDIAAALHHLHLRRTLVFT